MLSSPYYLRYAIYMHATMLSPPCARINAKQRLSIGASREAPADNACFSAMLFAMIFAMCFALPRAMLLAMRFAMCLLCILL